MGKYFLNDCKWLPASQYWGFWVGTGLNEKECLNWLMMSATGTEGALAHVPSDMIIVMWHINDMIILYIIVLALVT